MSKKGPLLQTGRAEGENDTWGHEGMTRSAEERGEIRKTRDVSENTVELSKQGEALILCFKDINILIMTH